ncbi:MAG: hypothetical protein ACYC8T_26025 [Myxococcaceae bacterium]
MDARTSNRLAKVMLAVAGCAAAAVAAYFLGGAPIYVANGLNAPVEAHVALEVVMVQPGGVAYVGRFFSSEVPISARMDGVEIEKDVVRPSRSTANLYNVLGAAPVVASSIVYTDQRDSSQERSAPNGAALCGNVFMPLHADDVFEDPPKTVSMPKNSKAVTRTWVHLDGDGRFPGCLTQLSGSPAKAGALALRLADHLPGMDHLYLTAARFFVEAGEAERGLSLLRKRAQTSDEPADHRQLRALLTSLGRRAEAIELSRRAYEADPDSERGYLYAEVLPPGQTLPIATRLLALHPESEGIRRTLAWALFDSHREHEALAHTRWFFAEEGRAPQHVRSWTDLHVAALVAEGGFDDAVRFLEEQASGHLEDELLLARIARVSQRQPTVAPEELALEGVSHQGREFMKAYFRLRLGEPTVLEPPELRQVPPLTILSKALNRPDSAVRAAEALTASEANTLGGEATALLLGEAWRTSNERAAQRLVSTQMPFLDVAPLRRFVLTGEGAEALYAVFPDERSAFWLARARVLEAKGDPGAAAALLEVERAGPVPGLARRAAVTWPTVLPRPAAPTDMHLEIRGDLVLRPRSAQGP